MLKTALRPIWIAGLILALEVSGVFVLLGKWQMDNAASAPPPLTQTETPVPLTGHFQPGAAMFGSEADQVVTMTGRFVPGTDVFVHPRLLGEREGYWAVTAFAVTASGLTLFGIGSAFWGLAAGLAVLGLGYAGTRWFPQA